MGNEIDVPEGTVLWMNGKPVTVATEDARREGFRSGEEVTPGALLKMRKVGQTTRINSDTTKGLEVPKGAEAIVSQASESVLHEAQVVEPPEGEG